MTPAQRHLIVASLERAAEHWADGDPDQAERWTATAWSFAHGIGDYIDTDVEEQDA